MAVWCSSPRRGRTSPCRNASASSRRIFGKWILQRNLGGVRRAMLDSAQYAVAIPGGTDALIHARCVPRGSDLPPPAWQVNAFPSLEHNSIDEAMQRLVPGVTPFCSWSHAEASTVWTPGDRSLLSDRGAEQGDPPGSLQCGVALTGVRDHGAVARRSGPCQLLLARSLFDVWFADDGQGYMRPAMVQEYLHTLDSKSTSTHSTTRAPESGQCVVLATRPSRWLCSWATQPRPRGL